MSEDQTNAEARPAAVDHPPLGQRAAIAARAELRGERTGILGATGRAPGVPSCPPRRVAPERWSVIAVMERMEEARHRKSLSLSADTRTVPAMPLALRHQYTLALMAAAVLLVVYGVLAYFFLPLVWKRFEHQRALAGFSMVTRTADGIPGDAINVGLVGSKEDVLCAMHAAGWFPADPTTLSSSLKIIGSVVLDRPYRDAPVSRLFYNGKRQDLAFEKPAGKSADRRHHVRLWQASDAGQEGRPVWFGAVTFDRGVGFSHRDAKITHHISPDIDAERDLLSGDLKDAKVVESTYEVEGLGPTLNGHNGGGDSYYTDGDIRFSVLTNGCGQRTETTAELDNPPLIEAKNRVWPVIAKAMRSLFGRREADGDE